MFVPAEDANGAVIGIRVAYAFDAMKAMRDVVLHYRRHGPASSTRPEGVLGDISAFAGAFGVLETDADGKQYAVDVKDVRVELIPDDGKPTKALLWMPVNGLLVLTFR